MSLYYWYVNYTPTDLQEDFIGANNISTYIKEFGNLVRHTKVDLCKQDFLQ